MEIFGRMVHQPGANLGSMTGSARTRKQEYFLLCQLQPSTKHYLTTKLIFKRINPNTRKNLSFLSTISFIHYLSIRLVIKRTVCDPLASIHKRQCPIRNSKLETFSEQWCERYCRFSRVKRVKSIYTLLVCLFVWMH